MKFDLSRADVSLPKPEPSTVEIETMDQLRQLWERFGGRSDLVIGFAKPGEAVDGSILIYDDYIE